MNQKNIMIIAVIIIIAVTFGFLVTYKQNVKMKKLQDQKIQDQKIRMEQELRAENVRKHKRELTKILDIKYQEGIEADKVIETYENRKNVINVYLKIRDGVTLNINELKESADTTLKFLDDIDTVKYFNNNNRQLIQEFTRE